MMRNYGRTSISYKIKHFINSLTRADFINVRNAVFGFFTASIFFFLVFILLPIIAAEI